MKECLCGEERIGKVLDDEGSKSAAIEAAGTGEVGKGFADELNGAAQQLNLEIKKLKI